MRINPIQEMISKRKNLNPGAAVSLEMTSISASTLPGGGAFFNLFYILFYFLPGGGRNAEFFQFKV